jgi:RNA recognition motif-containing protein
MCYISDGFSYRVFSQYGRVVDIVACKGLKLRGQAWVVFENAATATAAMRGKQGFNFYDKPLVLHYSKPDVIYTVYKLKLILYRE